MNNFLREAASSYLSDAAVLATLIRSGRETPAEALARATRLLAAGGRLRTVVEADAGALSATAHDRLQAAFELVRRLMEETLRRQDCLNSPQEVKRYLATRLREAQREIFAVLFLDTRHRLMVFEELCHGTIDGAIVPPRVVVQRALRHNAAAVIVAHNHPSGHAEPSQADIQLTRRLRDALALVEVRLLDHIVVGDGEHVSLAERGLLS
ncbi:MAG: DNA repair protein RadC [Candidatus Competibacteraceae bacterium]